MNLTITGRVKIWDFPIIRAYWKFHACYLTCYLFFSIGLGLPWWFIVLTLLLSITNRCGLNNKCVTNDSININFPGRWILACSPHLKDIVAHFPQIKIHFLPNMENGTSIWSSFGCSHENVYANNLLNNSPLLLTQQIMISIRIRWKSSGQNMNYGDCNLNHPLSMLLSSLPRRLNQEKSTYKSKMKIHLVSVRWWKISKRNSVLQQSSHRAIVLHQLLVHNCLPSHYINKFYLILLQAMLTFSSPNLMANGGES